MTAFGILLPEQWPRRPSQLLLVQMEPVLAENDGGGIFNLVVVEFTEVLHIDLALGGVRNGDEAANRPRSSVRNTLYGADARR